ncbi:delta-aminolevulinic acid dehydratase [Desulfosporosinus orientis DSM 765]|uniref:Delta-aminolevulinic acid dehydratase n=1 Tax=Desulfosporosinus orientis (strain ATCC 19365 / DSM 765 / NCIMB 8382 / VKM B-1628 / Singapore I) TaxID=768706 RepID=G7W5N6_DESOD|nr:porphobilinogen synthase [Desulfosporosinus orientis]AET66974.1 delta-aminolevulinic acid dehydratase [Desulfosporosinus orientis DSM 765]
MELKRRPRRLRANETIRSMVRENHIRIENLIYPMFVMPGEKQKVEVSSMPGVYNFSLDEFIIALKEVVELGVPAILLFGIPESKDSVGSGAYHEHGIVQQAVRLAKQHYPDLYVVTDVCLCEYTDHGHCGLIENGQILNDPTLKLLANTALSHAQAGADMVAPSDMMDGRVAAIRETLDKEGFSHIPIMAYSAKFASGFYGPFREAAGSTPQFGDRKTYQMDPANGDEAMLETELDIEEGADMIIVKPALSYGDIIYRTKQKYGIPLAAYNVSGEYAMVKAAAEKGWIDEKRIVMEALLSMKRAGADLLITYHALDVARWLREEI